MCLQRSVAQPIYSAIEIGMSCKVSWSYVKCIDIKAVACAHRHDFLFERHITAHTATFIHLPMAQAYGRCIPGLQLQRNARSSLTNLNEVTLKLAQVTENTDLTHWYFIHQGISQVHKMLSALHTTYKACSYIPQCPECRARKENSKAALLAWGEIRASCCTGNIFSASYLQSAGTNA